eukprot:Nitzschia sp. Nitz4//scaffold19_size178191//174325//175119//NITZ4_002017-RA/size178191-processed-gene-0.95-mRNA-1//-1//CDS//3329540801//4817//frame0
MPSHKAPSRKRNQPTQARSNKQVSHALSWALRHATHELGWTMTPGGWVPLSQVLASTHSRLKGITMEQIQQVVDTNDKQRFSIRPQPRSEFPGVQVENDEETNADDNPILCIRANQGHSVPGIDPNQLLTRLTPEELLSDYPCVVHGTYLEAWKSIEQQGLKKQNRTHIHCATGLPHDGGVISGMRRSCTVYIYLDIPTCVQDKIPFYRSENGVILTEGIDGVLAPKYFAQVTDPQGNLLNSSTQEDDPVDTAASNSVPEGTET